MTFFLPSCKVFRFGVCLLCLSATLAVTVVAADAASRPANKRGSVEIVSLLGDHFTSVYLGATAFSKKVHVTSVPSWNIDGFIERVIRDALHEDGKLRYRDTRIKRKYLAGIYDTSDQGFLEDKDYDLDKITAAVAFLRRRKVDTLILVIAGEVEDPIREASTRFKGYGIYRNSLFRTTNHIYSYYRFLMIDVQSGEVRYNRLVPDYSKIDGSRWSQSLNDMDRQGRRFLRETLKRMLTAKLHEVLNDSGLSARKPDPKPRRAPLHAATPQAGLKITGDGYTEAVRRVYHALRMRSVFERRAAHYVRSNMKAGKRFVLYRDVVADWSDRYFRWSAIRRQLVFMYTRLGLSQDELNDVAEIAEERGNAAATVTPQEAARLKAIWNRVADREALSELRQAVHARRELIIREADAL